jgi:hypothetical protein
MLLFFIDAAVSFFFFLNMVTTGLALGLGFKLAGVLPRG